MNLFQLNSLLHAVSIVFQRRGPVVEGLISLLPLQVDLGPLWLPPGVRGQNRIALSAGGACEIGHNQIGRASCRERV